MTDVLELVVNGHGVHSKQISRLGIAASIVGVTWIKGPR